MGKKAVITVDLKPHPLQTLRDVCTLAEATILAGKSRSTLLNAIHTGRMQGRPSITGGDWLVDIRSLIKAYPEAGVKSWLIR